MGSRNSLDGEDGGSRRPKRRRNVAGHAAGIAVMVAGIYAGGSRWEPTTMELSGGEPYTYGSAVVPEASSPEQMAAHFLNVGQGDAVLLEFSCGAVLIDTGGEENDAFNGKEAFGEAIAQFFDRRPDLRRTLDLVILSHPHLDHTNGVSELIDRGIKVKNVVDDGLTSGSGRVGQRKLAEYATELKAKHEVVSVAQTSGPSGYTSKILDPIKCGEVDPTIRALWGNASGYAMSNTDKGNANNNSVVVRLDFGESSFLFTGDIETAAIEGLLKSRSAESGLLDVDVLKLAHHGAKNAITAAFLKAVSPKFAVIQTGDPFAYQGAFSTWEYGHPTQLAMDLLMDPAIGVSEQRLPVTVNVGIKGVNKRDKKPPEWTTKTIDRAIYNPAWDGTVSITATLAGTLTVTTSPEADSATNADTLTGGGY